MPSPPPRLNTHNTRRVRSRAQKNTHDIDGRPQLALLLQALLELLILFELLGLEVALLLQARALVILAGFRRQKLVD